MPIDNENGVLALSQNLALLLQTEFRLILRLTFSQPRELLVDELDDLCETIGVYRQVIPAGVELIPPTQNVEQLGQHSIMNRRRVREQLNYHFDMVDGADFEEEGLIWDSGEAAAFE